jgi:hypothetical protein
MVRITLLRVLSAALLPAKDIKPFDVKLGLWETRVSTEMSGMAMPTMPQVPPDALSRMPPEQRARVEAMMKGRRGSPWTMTAKPCITKAVSRRRLRASDKSCAMTVVGSTPTKPVLQVDCTRDSMTGGTTIEHAEHVKGTTVVKTEGEHAMTKSNFETKFLSSDCGDVNPVLPK